jgi:uncharacterized protein (TIGR03067 family)
MIRGDVILVRFPHPTGLRGKKRPAVVVIAETIGGAMKFRGFMLVAAILALAGDKPRAGADKKSFQGSWSVLYGSKNGKAYADELLNSLKITFSRDKILIQTMDGTQKGAFELGKGKGKAFDEITIRHADGKTKPLKGIYKFDEKGVLWLCCGEPGADRPKKFNTDEGGKCEVLKLEREKS